MRCDEKPSSLRRLVFCFFSVCIFSCATTGGNFSRRAIPQFAFEFDDGAICVRDFAFESFPLEFHVARIDLNQVGLAFSSEPCTVERFAKKTGAKIAFNANPFDKKKKPVGVLFFDKKFFSAANSRYDAFLFEKKNGCLIPKIAERQDFDASNVEFACGGFWRILKDGEILPFKETQDSRLAVGYGKENRFLFVLQVEGEFKSKSTGTTFSESADILKNFGVTDAIMLDGGASASFVVDGVQRNSVRVKRRVSNCFGFL